MGADPMDLSANIQSPIRWSCGVKVMALAGVAYFPGAQGIGTSTTDFTGERIPDLPGASGSEPGAVWRSN